MAGSVKGHNVYDCAKEGGPAGSGEGESRKEQNLRGKGYIPSATEEIIAIFSLTCLQ